MLNKFPMYQYKYHVFNSKSRSKSFCKLKDYEEQFVTQQVHVNYNQPIYYLQFDGSKTRYGGSTAWLIFDEYGNELFREAKYTKPYYTNNQCEYQALIQGLKAIRRYRLQGQIKIQGDSELVINHLNGKWQLSKESNVQNHYYQAKHLLELIPFTELQHIGRSQNTMANDMAQRLTKEINYNSIQSIDIGVHTMQNVNNLLQETQVLFKNFPLEKKYDGLIIDPPYEYVNNQRDNVPSTLKPPYDTPLKEKIKCLPIYHILKDKGVCFLWSPGTQLPVAIEYLRSWKLDYLTVAVVWRKLGQNQYMYDSFLPVKKFLCEQQSNDFPIIEPYIGAGWTTAHCYEFVLVAQKGRKSPHRTDIRRSQDLSIPFNPEVHKELPYEIEERVYKHSQKPLQFYDLIADLYKVDQMDWLEIFARTRNEHNYYLDLYGNEIQNNFECKVHSNNENIVQSDNEGERQDQTSQSRAQNQVSNNQIQISQTQVPDLQENIPQVSRQQVQDLGQQSEVECESFKNFDELNSMDQYSQLFTSHLNQHSIFSVQLSPEKFGNDFQELKSQLKQNFKSNFNPKTYIYDVTDDPIEQDRLRTLNVGDNQLEPTREIYTILKEHLNAFTWNYPDDLVGTNCAEFEIKLKDYDKVICEKLRKTTQTKSEFTKKEIKALLEAGVIKRSSSPYASAIVIVSKKTGELRMCIDFRDLNKITIPDKSPLPRQDSLLQNLSGIRFYITLDFKSGFWQVIIRDGYGMYTAFITEEGLFEWLRMPFGLTNAPAMFQTIMNIVFAARLNRGIMVYVDDVVIYGHTLNELYDNLQWALQQIIKYNLKLNPKKCYFHVSSIQFLGHRIKNSVIQPDQEKISFLQSVKFPQTKRQMRQLLGLVNYFKKFIPNCDKLIKPLSLMTRNNFQVEDTPEALNSFNELKKILIELPSLKIPKDSDELVLHIFYDSDYGLYAVLTAIDLETKQEAPVEFASRSITDTQSRYQIQEGQLASIVWAIWKFKSLLYAKPFTLVVQEQITRWCLQTKELPTKLAKWALIVQSFEYYIQVRGARQQRAMLTKIAKQFNDLNQVLSFTKSDQLSMIVCEVCQQPTGGKTILMCDNCFRGFHKVCVGVIINENDIEPWYCQECTEIITSQDAKDPTQDLDLMFYLTYGRPTGKLTRTQHQQLIAKAAKYELDDDILYLKLHQPNGKTQRREIPSIGYRYTLVQYFHRNRGHKGVRSTLHHLSHFYYWPNMQRDVKTIIANCISCATENAKYFSIPQIKATKVHSEPFTMIAIDLIKMNKKTKRGNLHMIVCIDAYSKWVEVVPVPNKGANITARFLFNEIIARYGCPYVVRTDGGKEFQGDFAELIELFGIKHLISAPYYSQSNGMVERVNNTIRVSLRKLFNEPYMQQDWDDLLPYTLIGIRSSVSRATNFSPYQILFGREMVIPGFLVDKNNLTDWTKPDSNQLEEHMTAIRSTIKEREPLIKQGLKEARTEIEKEMSKTHVPTPYDFQFGDLVLQKWNPNNKMEPKGKGPFMFAKYTSEQKTNAVIFNLVTKILTKVSVSNLAPYGVIDIE